MILITHVQVTTAALGLRLRTGVEAILAVELNLCWVRKRALYCSMLRDDDEIRHNQDFSLRKGTPFLLRDLKLYEPSQSFVIEITFIAARQREYYSCEVQQPRTPWFGNKLQPGVTKSWSQQISRQLRLGRWRLRWPCLDLEPESPRFTLWTHFPTRLDQEKQAACGDSRHGHRRTTPWLAGCEKANSVLQKWWSLRATPRSQFRNSLPREERIWLCLVRLRAVTENGCCSDLWQRRYFAESSVRL